MFISIIGPKGLFGKQLRKNFKKKGIKYELLLKRYKGKIRL